MGKSISVREAVDKLIFFKYNDDFKLVECDSVDFKGADWLTEFCSIIDDIIVFDTVVVFSVFVICGSVSDGFCYCYFKQIEEFVRARYFW